MCQWWSAEILTNCINSHLLKPLCRRLISLPSLHYLMKHISFLMQPMPVIQSVCTNLSPLLFIPYVDLLDCIFGTQIWIFQHWQKECTMCVLYSIVNMVVASTSKYEECNEFTIPRIQTEEHRTGNGCLCVCVSRHNQTEAKKDTVKLVVDLQKRGCTTVATISACLSHCSSRGLSHSIMPRWIVSECTLALYSICP